MSDLPEGMKPFDRSEILPCLLCGKGIGHAGDLFFYEVSIGQVMVDVRSVRQIAGLELMMGNAAIASVFAPTSKIGARLPPSRFVVCEPCSLTREGIVLMSLLERAGEVEERRKESSDGG